MTIKIVEVRPPAPTPAVSRTTHTGPQRCDRCGVFDGYHALWCPERQFTTVNTRNDLCVHGIDFHLCHTCLEPREVRSAIEVAEHQPRVRGRFRLVYEKGEPVLQPVKESDNATASPKSANVCTTDAETRLNPGGYL